MISFSVGEVMGSVC